MNLFHLLLLCVFLICVVFVLLCKSSFWLLYNNLFLCLQNLCIACEITWFFFLLPSNMYFSILGGYQKTVKIIEGFKTVFTLNISKYHLFVKNMLASFIRLKINNLKIGFFCYTMSRYYIFNNNKPRGSS